VAVLGRLHQYNSVPGLRTELDRLYNFLQTMASKELAAHQIDGTGASVDDHRSRVTSGPETVQSLRVGVGSAVREICGYKRYQITSPAFSALPSDHTITKQIVTGDDDHPLNNLTPGDNVVVTRTNMMKPPNVVDMQLSSFIDFQTAGGGTGELYAVVTNHYSSSITLPQGDWWVFVTEHCAET